MISFSTRTGESLKGVFHLVKESRRAAIFLHPHPSYGGNMNSHVLLAEESVFHSLGYSTLRFNFHTVGKIGVSKGIYEANDVGAAIEYVKQNVEKLPEIILFCYSFGCGVGLEYCSRNPGIIGAIVAVAPAPLNLSKFNGPLLVVAPEKDEIFPLETTKKAFKNLQVQAELHVIKGADHFLGREEDIEELSDAVKNFCEKLKVESTL